MFPARREMTEEGLNASLLHITQSRKGLVEVDVKVTTDSLRPYFS